jgi:group I intron endonuclease
LVGVYKIENKINGKVYIGQTTDVRSRFSSHRWALRRGDHPSKDLQADWDKYGADAFSFEVIEKCRSIYLKGLERTYIEEYNATDPKCGYNKRAEKTVKRVGKRLARKHVAYLTPANEMAYFRKNGAITYNSLCEKCQNTCKQSFRSEILLCPAIV